MFFLPINKTRKKLYVVRIKRIQNNTCICVLKHSKKNKSLFEGENIIGVKTERIWTDSSEIVFVTIFFSDSESERIMCGYEYGIGVYR
jgi:hypothetical protein